MPSSNNAKNISLVFAIRAVLVFFLAALLTGCGPGTLSSLLLPGTLITGASACETTDCCVVAGYIACAVQWYGGAEQCFLSSVTARRSVNANDPELGRSLNTLAAIRTSMGDLNGAAQVLSEATALFEKLGVAHASEAADCWTYFAYLQLEQGAYGEAGESARKAIAAIESGSSEPSLVAAHAWIGLGRVFVETPEHWDEAEKALEKALTIAEALGDDSDEAKVHAYACLGDLLTRRGAWPQAEEYMQKALERAEVFSAVDQPYAAICYNNLGVIRLQQGRLDEADAYFDYASATLKVDERPEDAQMAAALHGKAFCLFKQKQLPESKALMRNAVAILEKCRGPNHPELARVLVDLACVHQSAGELDEARALLTRAREIYAKQGDGYVPALEHIDALRLSLK